MAIFFCTVWKRRSKRITSTERTITALFSILKKRQELGYTWKQRSECQRMKNTCDTHTRWGHTYNSLFIICYLIQCRPENPFSYGRNLSSVWQCVSAKDYYHMLSPFYLLQTWVLARTRGQRCQGRCSSWGSSEGLPPSLPLLSALHAWSQSHAEKNNINFTSDEENLDEGISNKIMCKPGFCLGVPSYGPPWTPCQTTCSQHSSANVIAYIH